MRSEGKSRFLCNSQLPNELITVHKLISDSTTALATQSICLQF